jgi:gamma-glutamyltranspeptidase/glutathione hydrolase
VNSEAPRNEAPRDEAPCDGLVVAALQEAADAGAESLRAGGSAVDAAVATAFALSVVDAASCGIGGYGGFLTYAPPDGAPVQVDFNTWVPQRLDASSLRMPGDIASLHEGGGSVAPLAVVPGLLAAHERFGRRPLAEVLRPAIRLARDGFPIGRELARAFSDHWVRTEGGEAGFASLFYASGEPPARGSLLVQADLAVTLETIARDGVAAFRGGRIVDAICATVQADGGFLEPSDFADERIAVGPAESTDFEAATIYGPPRETSGTGVLFSALAHIEPDRLGQNRGRAYVTELARALGLAWDERSRAALAALNANHTTHLCTADAGGGLASLTFTHGPRRFGSGLVGEGTGIILNSGINLFAPTADGPLAVTNMAPVIVLDSNGDRHAVGSVGGPRIPGIILSSVVDVVHYGASIATSIAAPHLSVRATDGVLEAEPELLQVMELDGTGRTLVAGVSFGATSGITHTPRGALAGADPRFESGVARVQRG